MYTVLVSLILLLSLPYLVVSAIIGKNRKGWFERFGFVGGIRPGGLVWVHCASVGEVNTAREYIRKLSEQEPGRAIVLSVITPAGRRVAENLGLPVAKIFYLPFD